MRHLMVALVCGALVLFSTGCGGSPEKADTSHLDISNNPEAEAAAQAARAAYEGAGRQGPQAPAADDKK
jgi:hypothetical protein